MVVRSRYLLVVLVVLVTSWVASAETNLGCCVTDNPSALCFDGSINQYSDTRASFEQRCRDAMVQPFASENLRGAGVANTCSPYAGTNGVCELGCCCQTAANPKTGDLLTRYVCDQIGKQDPLNDPRQFRAKPSGVSCAQVCAGTTPTQDITATVTGIVVKKGVTPDVPLAGVTVSLATSSGTSDVTKQDGSFTLVVPVGTRYFTAVPSTVQPSTSQGCRTASVTKTVSGPTTIRIELDCQQAACTNQPSIISQVVTDATSTSFTVSNPDSCSTLTTTQIRRCQKTTAGIDTKSCTYVSRTGASFSFSDSVQSTEVCYIVDAKFRSGSPSSISSAPVCVTATSSACSGRNGESWCGTSQGQPAVLSCDASGKFQATACPAGQICSPNSAKCVDAPKCDRCNGLLGLFSSMNFAVPYGALQVSCSALAGSQYPTQERCYLDTAKRAADGSIQQTLVPTYNACVLVQNCAEYKSKSACEKNTCGVEQSPTACSWISLNDELGTGVCTSKKNASCSVCQETGSCTKELCEKISPNCYFDGLPNGLSTEVFDYPRCVQKEQMACRYYDTKTDCLGTAGQPAVYDTIVTTSRTGGTNARTKNSADKLGIGACSAWIDDGIQSRCIKNADNSQNLIGEDDCIENNPLAFQNNPSCVQDITPPTTTLALRTPPQYGLQELNPIPFSVNDNFSPPDAIKTYVCLGNGCYPKSSSINPLPDPGVYTLRYYSEDQNGNLEQVKTAQLEITDTGYAVLKSVEIAENSQTAPSAGSS